MHVRSVRSGLTESRHHVTVAAVDRRGTILLDDGDVDEAFFYRSVIKPVQATAALDAGVDLPDEHLAVASASHGAFPVHIAIVRAILADGGLDESALACPPAPSAPYTRGRSRRRFEPDRIYHNCSGKHATMLRACAAKGWPLRSYLEPDHPHQMRITALIEETTGTRPDVVGVDGCGAPTLQGSVRGVARCFASLSSSDRFDRVTKAMIRFPSLVADNVRSEGVLGRWWGGPVKGGAAGIIALGRHGIGIAAKSRSGDPAPALSAAIAAADRLGLVSPAMAEGLEAVAEPPVLGGGRTVGSLRVG